MILRDKYGPLRRVIGYEKRAIEGTDIMIGVEILECGHRVCIKTDIYGETNAYRRRCRYCRDIAKARKES